MILFCVFSHLLYCIRCSRAASLYQKCSRYFVKDESLVNMLKKVFTNSYLNVLNCSKTVTDLFKTNSLSYYSLYIYYLDFRFLKLIYHENFGSIYFKCCYKPFRLFFISTCEFLLDHSLDPAELATLHDSRQTCC